MQNTKYPHTKRAESSDLQPDHQVFTLFESFPEPVFMIDPDGIILQCNMTYAARFCKQPEQCMGANVYDMLTQALVNPDIAARRRNKVEEVLSTGKRLHIDDSQDDQIYRSTIYPIRSVEGVITRLLIIAQNITDHYTAEQAFAESQEQLKLIMREAHAGIWEWDLRTNENVWSDELWALYGLDPISCKPSYAAWRDSILPEDRLRVEQTVTAAASQGKEFSVTWQTIDSSGNNLTLLSKGIPYKNNVGEVVVRYIGIVVDISEQKLAETVIQRQSRALLATNNCNEALLHAKDETALLQKICSIIVDTGGYRMAWVGYAELDEAKSISIVAETGFLTDYTQHRWLSWADVPQGRGPAGLAIRTGRPCAINNIVDNPLFDPWRKDALNQGFESLIALPLLADGEAFGLLHVYSSRPDAFDTVETNLLMSLADNLAYGITTLRSEKAKEIALADNEKLQGQLLQAQKMEMLGQLAGGIAHDFNNMLSVILGHTDLALQEHDLAQPIRGDLYSIQAAAKRSADLTSQLLAFARKQAVQRKTLQLNTIVEHTVPVLQRLIGENISLYWEPEASDAYIKIDPVQLDQILVNLCINSRDAITGTGKITIETRALSVKENEPATNHPALIPGEYVMLAVSDNGTGISDTILPHVFEPFFTTKEVGKGTGLGLSTVYGIVKQNDGFIDCLSEPGKGTSVRVFLPRVRHKEIMSSPVTPAAITRGEGTILLVEDEPTILKICTMMLEKNGYRVLTASSPAEAIKIAEQNGAFDLLLTDVIMPEMNGCELAKKLQTTNPGIKTLFMSGYTADFLSENEGIDKDIEILGKPFDAKALTVKLSQLLPPPRRGVQRKSHE
ncbi:MAG: GAF domain-containing protein [Chlorobiaceae bacterium]